MPKEDVIAMDGPAASGKSVVGQRLAGRLGYRFVDTGSMYRAVTLLALEQGVALDDGGALSRIASSIAIRIGDIDPETSLPRLYVDGREVTREIRSPRVDQAVSQVSRFPGVRDALVRLQRRLAEEGQVVMVGRDIGTVVLPDAGLKIYLEASLDERARRRYREQRQRGAQVELKTVLEDLRRRDRLDTEREVSPLKPAEDAKRIMTDDCTIDQVVEKLWQLATRD